MTDRDRFGAEGEQLRGKFERAIGDVTGSDSTTARGYIHEAEGVAKEKVADVKDAVQRQASSLQRDLSKASNVAKERVSSMDTKTVAMVAGGALAAYALYNRVVNGVFPEVDLTGLEKKGLGALDAGKENATKVKSTAEQFGGRVATKVGDLGDQVTDLTDQLTGRKRKRSLPGFMSVVAPLAIIAAVVAVYTNMVSPQRYEPSYRPTM